MDRRNRERRSFFRGPVRPGRVMAIRYRSKDSDRWSATQTRNIGVGGALIVTDALLPIGSAISLELRLPTTGRTLLLAAEVRWVSAGEGMGVQFTGIDVDVLLELNDYFLTLERRV